MLFLIVCFEVFSFFVRDFLAFPSFFYYFCKLAPPILPVFLSVYMLLLLVQYRVNTYYYQPAAGGGRLRINLIQLTHLGGRDEIAEQTLDQFDALRSNRLAVVKCQEPRPKAGESLRLLRAHRNQQFSGENSSYRLIDHETIMAGAQF